MNEGKEELTPEELKKKAYLMGLRLKNSGLDAETIYARLEKQGIPEELATEVARDTLILSLGWCYSPTKLHTFKPETGCKFDSSSRLLVTQTRYITQHQQKARTHPLNKRK